MGLFAKDHALEAVELRTRSAKPGLRGFEFEKLPRTVRHQIYRELLLKPVDDDSAAEDDGDSYASEHDKLSERIEGLMVEIGEGDNQMHPEIMRTNKKIHDEAAAVLRLITKLRLYVSTRGNEHDRTQAVAIYWTTINVNHVCKKLTLNDLKILKVDFYNALGRKHGGSARKGYYGERCLEPFKKCRAEKRSHFFINDYSSPAYAPKLKAVIEGPKDAKFLARRKAKEDESESDFDDQGGSGN
ncbi:hypothetical protein HO173_003656 [Letharia columbiana]|uniref:Uncharacterized protein n=1 Tax=Letharia columbiana TaxID=112416 RepID=A0A8H6G0Q8_9LECA|nr:uncharacterized protein HO173_003656 [Letharia columbiana]KAF6238376.1 hypothetical protein HO173_003656 [Letharia columbiana]